MPGKLITLTAAILLASTVGCGSGTSSFDRALAEHRSKYLLESEPTDVIGLSEARAVLAANSDGDAGQEAIVIGRVGGVPNPWHDGTAAFVISDPSVDAVAHAGHDGPCGDGCAFCARAKANDSALKLALVKVIDHEGEVVPLDARRLFGLEVGQIVVVRGRAAVDELGQLTLLANGLYVRR